MPEIDNIEIRSDEVQEIIGTPPSRIVRSGITSVFVVIFILVVGSFFFKYPDIIYSHISVIGENPSAEIKARSNGKITELFVSDKQKVYTNQTLGIIENTCNFNDLNKLISDLDSVEMFLIDIEKNISRFSSNNSFKLGELQKYYTDFFSKINKYKKFLELNYHEKKIIAYKKQITAYNNYLSNLKKQVQLSEKDLNLTMNQLKRDSVLFKKEFLSETDFEKSKSVLIQKKKYFEDARSLIANTRIRIAELEQLVIETEILKLDEQNEYEISIYELYENLNAQIKLWEQTYLLRSPIDGTITFTNFRNINQNVNTGETVFTIVPNKTSELVGYAEVPLSGSGKVKVGHSVNIKFDDFPDTQFGMVRGTVESISLVQSNEFYTVKVKLPDSLYTNYKITLPFKQNMTGTAEILTDELPLAARIINPIKSLFYEKF